MAEKYAFPACLLSYVLLLACWPLFVAENVEALLVASLCFHSQKHNQAVLQLFVLPFADPFIFRHKKRKKLIEDGTATNR